ncbi:hypothetical protein PoB_000259100 [Plakobranchus ocellatus]|uniref:Uncharacterized protein n=1 Tax=Plakobranchus ocellatus TaxID=259542 RepID=A0AAV3XBB6_9GAST|nr:hypothetical protein PoB_000259100 [Plakobranchus ocellatus]
MTVHSVVSFYRDPEGQLHRHSILMLSSDAAYDHHTVNTLMRRAIRFLQSMLPVRSVRLDVLVHSIKTRMPWQSHGWVPFQSLNIKKLKGSKMNKNHDFNLMPDLLFQRCYF